MKKLVLASVLAALMTAPAGAADMAVKTPVAKYVPYDWNGFYVGFQGGGGWAFHDLILNPGGDIDVLNSVYGYYAGGYAGYNFQVAPWFMLGAEGAWAWSNIRMTDSDCINGIAICSNNIKSLGSVRGRVGAVFDMVHGYLAAGWGWGGARWDRTILPNFNLPGVSPSLSGVTVAAGVEIGLTKDIIIRSQWERFDFKNSFGPGQLDVVPTQTKSLVNVLTVGIAAKFGGPVVAKY
jgi:outer membrane immunogenic protein